LLLWLCCNWNWVKHAIGPNWSWKLELELELEKWGRKARERGATEKQKRFLVFI